MNGYKNKLGPIPPENFDNDTKFVPFEEMSESDRAAYERMQKTFFGDGKSPKK